MKKFIGLFLSLILCFTALVSVGCREEGGYDASKVQLFVATYEGGQGDQWLRDAAKVFEERHANDTFENGKVGVEVVVDPAKEYGGDNLTGFASYDNVDVMFTNNSNLYNSLAKQGALLDLTEAVSTPLSEYNESKSILDKMDESYADWFNVDGKVYGIPWFVSSHVINYDVDLFEENNYYFAKSGDTEKGKNTTFVIDDSEERSMGPDGEYGTYDDGLPATFDEFFTLCDKIAGDGNVPTLWTGQFQAYMSNVLLCLYADIEGKDGLDAHFKFKGTADSLISNIDANGNVSLQPATEINMANGYLTYQQAGRYYALNFLDRLFNTKNGGGKGVYFNENDCKSSSVSHTGAQDLFVYSGPDTSEDDIAMLFEGTWWFNESQGSRMDCAEKFDYEESSRRFGIMPFPKPNASYIGEGFTTYDSHAPVVFARANMDDYKKDLAIDFIRFTTTDSRLAEFTKSTNLVRPYDYEISSTDLSNMPYYGQQNYMVSKNENSVNYLGLSRNPIVLANPNMCGSTFWRTKGGKDTPSTLFFSSSYVTSKNNAKEYFDDFADYDQTYWVDSYGDYFD